MSNLRASVSIFDHQGGETAVSGPLNVTPGDDPGSVALWVGLEDENIAAGIIVEDVVTLRNKLDEQGGSSMTLSGRIRDAVRERLTVVSERRVAVESEVPRTTLHRFVAQGCRLQGDNLDRLYAWVDNRAGSSEAVL